MRITREPSPLQIMTDQKQLENVEYFNYLGSIKTNDARCTREIKSRNAMANAAFNKMKTLFTSKLNLNLKKKVLMFYIWSRTVYGAENRTLQKVDQKYLGSSQMWR
jgi:hypothetical protein